MKTQDILLKLRKENNLSQDELALKVYVTRQAVSRWETGETVPNTETLKLLSKVFNVSINTLLGEPQKLICQCCGMPLDDESIISYNKDGSINNDYCKWCYAEGQFTYHNMDDLINTCVKYMVTKDCKEEDARKYMEELLPTLNYWKQYENLSDNGEFEKYKELLLSEINRFEIEGMPKIIKLNPLVGKYVNINYTLPNAKKVDFLDNNKTYLGNEVHSLFSEDVCFGIIADLSFILIARYEKNGANPELILYKKR